MEFCNYCDAEVEQDELTCCDVCGDDGCENCMPDGRCVGCDRAERDMNAPLPIDDLTDDLDDFDE